LSHGFVDNGQCLNCSQWWF